MIDVQSAVITAVALLALFGVGYWLLTRRSSVNGDTDQREQTKEDLRLEAENPARHERIGIVGRARVQPTTTLLFFGCIVAFLLVVAVGAYQVAKTGSPSEMQYADQIELGIMGFILFGGGAWFKMRMDAKAGELTITYEGDEKNVTDTLYYDKSLVQPLFDDSGDRDALLVPVFKKSRILGLFWRPKLSADDPTVRDVEKNLPEDQVTYEVPLDASTTWNQADDRITVRAKDTDPVTNPDRRASYEFVPSDRKSEAEIQDIKDENQQLRQQVEHEKRINGVQSEQLEQLREALENREHDSLDHLDESFDMYLQIMHALSSETGNGNGNGTGTPRDALEGAPGNAGAGNGTASE